MTRAAWLKLRNSFIVGSVLAFGIGMVVNYVVYLKRDELRDWKRLEVLFRDVGGLREKDPVMFNGARIGRVARIQFYKAQWQLVVLEYEGEILLHDQGSKIEIVPLNALGRVAVEVVPGDAASGPLDLAALPEGRFEGNIREAIGAGGGQPTPGRQKIIKRQLETYARETSRALQPNSSVLGGWLFSTERYHETREGLGELARTWEGIDRALADFEARQAREGFLSEESFILAAQTLARFEASMTQFRNGFREAERGHGLAGRLLTDPNAAREARQVWLGQGEAVAEAAAYKGSLGRLIRPPGAEADALRGSIERWDQLTREGDRGRGVLGTLSFPAYGEGFAAGMRGMEATFRRLRESQERDDAREQVEDTLGNVDDFLNKAQQGLEGLRRGLPDKTFHGAVFAVF